jgi:replication factor C subunit 3/5|tara:strand:+ start:357 stop:1298 length:942 start_codon:yes stop_codon:yes gene_type:complete
MNENNSIPWVEKYRPNHLDEVVLDKNNRIILKNIIEKKHFPNLLLYGPPGTGKTTTIINLINSYQDKIGERFKELMIHLNASDERGIDIIRNQIASFVNSKGLFNKGMKFIVLDEVDYMTKNAQLALKYLLHNSNSNIRYCLICNYISRIDESLQNEFVRLRFNKLPENEILKFLHKVVINENLNIDNSVINNIQNIYQSDIRSMINYIQSNQNILSDYKIIDNNTWNHMTTSLKNKTFSENIEIINNLSLYYEKEKKDLLKEYIIYIIDKNIETITKEFLNFIENLLHNQDLGEDYFVKYFVSRVVSLLNEL